MKRHLALLVAVAAQLADAVTFAVAVRAGVPLADEANPIARAIYPVIGLGGVVDLKLAGLAVLVLLLALSERLRIGRSGGLRLVVVGGALIAIAGVVGALANVGAALSVA